MVERDRWTWPLLIALLAIAASSSGLANQYVQDEVGIIWKNPMIHDLSGAPRLLLAPYWPPPLMAGLYRPLALVTYSLQWAAGGGSPLLFRLVSYLLYALTAVAFFRLARLRLPLLPAAASAALFAVHPVHVEAVAAAVNQGELWVALLACLATTLFLRERDHGGPVRSGTALALAGLYLLACLFKENALVLPGLLVAAEIVLAPTGQSLRERARQVRPTILLLLLVAVAFVGLRTWVLSGNVVGAPPAEGLVGLTMYQRALTMLGVVPHWFRLLFWPAHLQADYSPAEIVARTSWGPAQTLGALLLVAAVTAAVAARRRAPVVSFGIAWCAVALFPVHNVLVPTGIVLAERTLFLPSVGAMLVAGGVGALVLERAAPRGRLLLAAATGVVLMLGLLRSATRHPVWHDTFKLWYQTANEDAPRSFRAHAAMAEQYFAIGQEHMGETEYQLAMQFAPPTVAGVPMQLADRLRSRGFCYPAAQLYRKVVGLQPESAPARAALVACLLYLGHYKDARFHARIGISFGEGRDRFQQALATADSALRFSAPPGTVRLQVSAADPVGRFMIIGEKK